MPRPKGRGAARQNKRGDASLKSAWADGNYHNRDEDAASGSTSDSELEEGNSRGNHRIDTRSESLCLDLIFLIEAKLTAFMEKPCHCTHS